MTLNPHIFREFSIRGHAERDLPDAIASKIGQAIGTYFAQTYQTSTPKLVIGHDVRLSSPRVHGAAIAGLLKSGAEAIDIALVPTPMLNFATDYFSALGGIMVTASHNPPADNGFKLRAERTLMGDDLRQLYQLIEAGQLTEGVGQLHREDVQSAYLEALRQQAKPSRKMNIVIDGGNGANGPIFSQFLRDQGHQVTEIFTELDGNFPNRSPDPTKANALTVAGEAIRQQKAICGLAFDGDGDRLVLLDELGQAHMGDIILLLLARQRLQNGPATIIHDISCSQALTEDILAHGGQSQGAPVGYAFIHNKMLDVGATLGGEASGHIFWLEADFKFDDAMLAAVHLLNYLSQQDQPLSRMIASLPQYHTSPHERLYCPDALKTAVIAALVAHFQANHPVDTTDGAKIQFETGWALVRQSKTQPALTLRAEGKTATDLAQIQANLTQVVRQTLSQHGVNPDESLH